MRLGTQNNSALLRSTLQCLLVMVFALRSLLPEGYMPQTAEEGGILTVRICDAYGGKQMQLNLKTGALEEVGETSNEPGTSTDHSMKSSCAFAAGALLGGGEVSPDLTLAYFGPPLLAGRPVHHLPESGASKAPLPPRGPPASV